jgi:virulence factor Mce-like protein
MQSVSFFRSRTVWGTAAMIVLMVIAVIAAMLYINPPGRQIVTFYTRDAAAIRTGDDVRIAGISVGKVEDMELEADRVRVRAQVKNSAFVGDQSQIEVRMLTVVGGYYVAINSLGDAPLGEHPIPVERTTMPYDLVRTLTDATKITDNVATKPVKESLDELNASLEGTNVDALAAVLDAGNAVMSTVDRQRGQITKILNLSDEYIQSLADFRGELKELIMKISILEQTLMLYSKGFGDSLAGMGDILERVEPLGRFYTNHRDKFLAKVRDWLFKARAWADRDGAVVRGLGRIRDKIERVLDGQNARPEFLATDICLPIPGSVC